MADETARGRVGVRACPVRYEITSRSSSSFTEVRARETTYPTPRSPNGSRTRIQPIVDADPKQGQ